MSDETPQTVDPGKEVRIARLRLDVTQEEAARRMGIRRERLSQIEGGNLRSSLRVWEIFAIKDLLGVPLEAWEHYGKGNCE